MNDLTQARDLIKKCKDTQDPHLDLGNCGITDLDQLPELFECTHLEVLILSNKREWVESSDKRMNNRISSIPSKIVNLKNITKLQINGNWNDRWEITNIHFLENLTGLQNLDLSYNQITDFRFLENLTGLQNLYLNNNQITDFRFLENLTGLQNLDLSYNQITDIRFLENLTGLQTLVLSNNQITDIRFLENLTRLQTLNLRNNQITDIRFLENLTGLQNLDLRNNQITDFRFLENLTGLQYLDLSDNQIKDIRFLENLTRLQTLNLSDNQIKDITPLESIVKNLNKICIDNNPYFNKNNIILNPYENHKDILLNEFSKLANEKRLIKYPLKICLLGNHHSGKTTFLDYFFTGEIKEQASTHILTIRPYIDCAEKEKKELPNAIFYDFGGQDYYHGIYKAFLTTSSTNLLFWHKDTDKNEIGEDHSDNNKKDTKKSDVAKEHNHENSKTFHFNRQYWLGQLAYIEEFYKEKDKKTIIDPDTTKEIGDPLLNLYQIQTFSDQNPQNIYIHEATLKYIYISLNSKILNINDEQKGTTANSKQLALDAFVAELKEKIAEQQLENKSKDEINLYRYILDNRDTQNKMNVSDLLEHYGKTNSELNLLQAELDQLSKKGLILYYKNAGELSDYVWINPQETVKKIHDIFNKDEALKEHHGKILENKLKDSINDNQLIEMLLYNKVIYLDEKNTKGATFIVPSYLKSTTDEEDRFTFKTFNKYNFSLKFEHFIPFGFINQLICYYGGIGELKSYRKDQLIFTQNEKKTTILIKLDYQKLLIEVSIDTHTKNVKNIERELFFDLLRMYWGEEQNQKRELKNRDKRGEESDKDPILEHYEDIRNEKNKTTAAPPDMYLSLNGVEYVHYKTLEDETKTRNSILASKIIGSELDLNNAITLSTRNFSRFSNNKNIKKMKKIFISYSRKDFEYKDALKKHLNMLSHFDIADNWSCEEIKIGNWHEQIQEQLEASDLIIYMLSVDFFNSTYILEEEVLKGHKLVNENKNKKKLCVIVSDFIGLDKLKDENTNYNELQNSILSLEDNQYLPYAQENTSTVYEKKSEFFKPLVRFPKNEIDMAFTQIVGKIQETLK